MQDDLVLGKSVGYKYYYDPTLLQSIARKINRDLIDTPLEIPFQGYDCWNLYELSWLNAKGMPQVAIGEVYVPCESPNLIESKSFKLYLNSFNQSSFPTWEHVKKTMTEDLSRCAGASVDVQLWKLEEAPQGGIYEFDGICLDALDLEIVHEGFSNHYLQDALIGLKKGHHQVYSHLLKSNCLITHQPDWGSVYIEYLGKEISPEQLLKYLISFRMHNEFHEQCVERIFTDLSNKCHPEDLQVFARYTRRGGLDINPYRSSNPVTLEQMQEMNRRLVRQ